MCFSTSVKQPDPAPAPPAPEPVPESITPADTTLSNTRDTVNTKRRGLTSYRTDLNIPGGTAGTGLNVPV